MRWQIALEIKRAASIGFGNFFHQQILDQTTQQSRARRSDKPLFAARHHRQQTHDAHKFEDGTPHLFRVRRPGRESRWQPGGRVIAIEKHLNAIP